MYPLVKYHKGDGTPDHGGGDVIEEGAEDKDHHQQGEASLPVAGQEARQNLRQMRFVEVFGQDAETEQQADEVEQNSPLPLVTVAAEQMLYEGEVIQQRVLGQQNGGQAAQCHPHGDMVQQRNPQQRQGKQDELDPDAARSQQGVAESACQGGGAKQQAGAQQGDKRHQSAGGSGGHGFFSLRYRSRNEFLFRRQSLLLGNHPVLEVFASLAVGLVVPIFQHLQRLFALGHRH